MCATTITILSSLANSLLLRRTSLTFKKNKCRGSTSGMRGRIVDQLVLLSYIFTTIITKGSLVGPFFKPTWLPFLL